MPFDESKHPRDSRGRFVATGGGLGVFIAVVVVAALSGGPGSATDASGAWSRSGVRFSRQAHQTAGDCAAHAYGKVQRYLREHPCVRLYRARFTGTDDDGHTMTVTTQAVTMATTGQATHLKRLIDRPDTGNLDKLGTSFAAAHFATSRHGTTVTIAETAPQGLGSAPSAVLDTAAAAALHLPAE